MKHIIYTLTLVFLLASCEKEALDTYEGGSGIYFENAGILLDTAEVAWGLKNSEVTKQSIRFEVRLVGDVKDYDRPFTISINDDPLGRTAVVNEDYLPFPLEHKIPKGQASTFIEIELLRNPILTEENRVLTIALEESDELNFLYSRKLTDSLGVERLLDAQRVVKMTENFPMPRWWLIYGNGIFGTWSAKKAVLICDLMGIDREVWVGDLVSNANFTEGLLRYAGVYVHRWLQQQDPPVLEDDETPMQMGTLSRR